MKAISLWEPWGTAVAERIKRIETRGWRTSYRGPLAIHCSRTTLHVGFIHDPAVREYFYSAGVRGRGNLTFGAVIAVAVLDDCIPVEELTGLTDQERALGNYAPGRFAWKLGLVGVLPHPVPWRGSQGFFEVPDRLLNHVREAHHAGM